MKYIKATLTSKDPLGFTDEERREAPAAFEEMKKEVIEDAADMERQGVVVSLGVEEVEE